MTQDSGPEDGLVPPHKEFFFITKGNLSLLQASEPGISQSLVSILLVPEGGFPLRLAGVSTPLAFSFTWYFYVPMWDATIVYEWVLCEPRSCE